MSNLARLSSGRVCLRRWRDEDRKAFAAMNADVRVMEFFRSCLTRTESDAMVDRIEAHFREHGFGLWAIEVPGVADFVGFAGLAWARFNAPSRLVSKWDGGSASNTGEKVTQQRRRDRRLGKIGSKSTTR